MRFEEDAVFCSSATVFEAVLLAYLGECSPSALLAWHAGLCLAMAAVVVSRVQSHTDNGLLSFATVAIACTGVVGGVGCTLLAWWRVMARSHQVKCSGWHDSSDAAESGPAAKLAAQIQTGRAIDPFTPVPSSLEGALQDGPPDRRKAALYLLRTKYHPAFANALKVALATDTHAIRATANAVFASLIQTALLQVRSLGARPIDGESVAHQLAVDANSLLLRTPLGVVRSPFCELIAGELYTLSQKIISVHPHHKLAIVVGAKALMVLGKYREAADLLDRSESNDEEIAALLRDCLLKLRAYGDSAGLRRAIADSGQS